MLAAKDPSSQGTKDPSSQGTIEGIVTLTRMFCDTARQRDRYVTHCANLINVRPSSLDHVSAATEAADYPLPPAASNDDTSEDSMVGTYHTTR